MLNRKLLEVLQRLNLTEKGQLRQFLLSPFFNASSKAGDIVKLYDLIVLYDADESHPALTKEIVFQQFFPLNEFEANVKGPLDSLTTALFHLVRKFLAQIEMQREAGEVYEYWAMAKFCRKYGLEDRFWQNIQQARKIQDDSPQRDATYFFKQFKIEEEEQSFRGLYNSFSDYNNLHALEDNLDKYYSILKFEVMTALEDQKAIAALEDSPNRFLNEVVMTLSKEGGILDIPLNRIYRCILGLIRDANNLDGVQTLEELTNQYRKQISPEKYNNIMAFQRSIWVRKYMQSGEGNVRSQIFELYRRHLEEGWFYIDNSIPMNSIYNLTIVALKIENFDWSKKVLDDHPPERICGTRYPKDIHSLCVAEYYFAIKNYDEAEQTLVYRLFENTFMSISADVLLIKIYYETGNELLETRISALYKKVQRSKVATKRKEVYLNFLRKLDKIIKYGWMDNKSPKRLKLIEEIKALPGIASREWLLEKLE